MESSIYRYESPMAPNLHIFQETAVEAFPMAIVGFAVAFSVAKVYSVKHDYTIDGNQVRYVQLHQSWSCLLIQVLGNVMIYICFHLAVGADSFWSQ